MSRNNPVLLVVPCCISRQLQYLFSISKIKHFPIIAKNKKKIVFFFLFVFTSAARYSRTAAR
ncbi:hypothetical protein Hanom_Chr07g00661921 [Helianthus anomalus]